ncbi:ankyrin-1 [Halyomorpha halys]|uniref:ankyrin-1 n=1 Tax=Halyomorpha halys TaxID=286706 RepID=UPI0006D4E95D|nr:ankyrin-1-like [Halyomorpha halys]
MGKNKKEEINNGPVKASSKLHNLIKKKITMAVEFASKASIYNPEVTATELTTAQSILLSLMHSLLTNDLGFCVTLLELATSVDHLRSSYLPTWLRDDFNFDDQQVLRVLSKAAFLVQSGVLIIPTHILKVFVSLSPKYRVVECCRASGNTDTLKFLSEFNLQEYSSNHQLTMASSFTPNSVEMNRSNNINILPTSNNSRTMGDPFFSNLFLNHSVQKPITDVAAKVASFRNMSVPQVLVNRPVLKPMTEGAAKQEPLRNMNVQTMPNLLDIESSFVERTENPSPTLQEVWIENSAAESASGPITTNQASSNELYMCTVREYLKVPEDFDDEELLSLITYSDSEGRTPLHRAVKDGNPHVVECMLALGAKVNEKDTFGSTPSHCAASIGSIPMLQVLAQNQADFSLCRNDGCTPLHEAIINGHEAVCRWLLEHGSEINVRNIDGCAPLHLAAQWNKHGIVKFLLENGADSKIYSNNGKTPADVAREEGHTSIVELLSV